VHLGCERRSAPGELGPRRRTAMSAAGAAAAPFGRPHLTVVVVTYSPGEALERFLDSLEAATSSPYQVVLADNGSTDGAPEHAADTRDGVRLLPTGGNVGYGAAANIGARSTDAQWLLVANPDIVWSPGAIDALFEATE